MYKIDLHTHSIGSPDGGLTARDYKDLLAAKTLDYIAVTDHDSIAHAVILQEEIGEQIIVGEEIKTTHGEIIGLYLKECIPAGKSPAETVRLIHEQNGLVLIPHPFETVRSGMDEAALADIADEVDIIEIANARAVFQNKSDLAKRWQVNHGWAGAANSDAHTVSGCGRTYSTVEEPPTKDSLVELLLQAKHANRFPGAKALAAPKYHRLRKKFGHA